MYVIINFVVMLSIKVQNVFCRPTAVLESLKASKKSIKNKYYNV